MQPASPQEVYAAILNRGETFRHIAVMFRNRIRQARQAVGVAVRFPCGTTRASGKTKGGAPDIAVGGRAGCVVPPSRCQLPVRKVPGWRALGFPPVL